MKTKTKIVATIGPASDSKEKIREMIYEGMDVCRINFSHGNHEDAAAIIKTVQDLNEENDTHVALLADLQGPKIRIGEVEEGSELNDGDKFEITTEACTGNSERVFINYKQFPEDVDVGERILIDDGKIVLEVTFTDKKKLVETSVINGGPLSSRKGVNLPNTRISLPCLTEKDKEDLDFILQNDLHWIALSFVRSAQDIIDLKEVIKKNNRRIRVIAKIEKPEAIEDIDNIVEVADGIMVARGDLGLEIPMESVPLVQKMLVKKCLNVSKPIIIATQMMESMIENLHPNRAEVSDVANSVMDGADALMLSGETSVGKYPTEVIKNMCKIITQVETYEDIYNHELSPVYNNDRFISNAICFSASRLAQRANAKAIITMTHSGYTAFKISSFRPDSNIFIFTENKGILCMLNLIWGVRGFYYDKYESTDQTIEDIKRLLKEKGFLKEKDKVINIASMPITDKGKSNMLKLSEVN